MTNNKVELSLFLNDNLDKLEDAHYLFIQSPEGAIISHTFTKGFPKGLLSFRLNSQQPYRIKEFLNNDKKIYDIAFPILEGELGVLHLGVSLESDKKDIAQISKINHYVAIVVLVGLGAGILVFLTIGFPFSSKIIKLKNLASKIGQGDLEVKIDVKSKDEIGALASAFNEMVLRLKENIREIKRLNIIEERNKIAFDLHDGCAQHAANIIKRIELFERLNRLDPKKAREELQGIKESTRDSLARTRHMIFDLKTQDDSYFDLVRSVREYATAFGRENNVALELTITGAGEAIEAGKAKSVFYLVLEALANIRKHAGATKVQVDIRRQQDFFIISITDNGCGFDVGHMQRGANRDGKWGLISMEERIRRLEGKYVIDSAPGRGTRVSFHIPLTEESVTYEI